MNNKYKFKLMYDVSDIKDSMQIDSGTLIASLKTPKGEMTIEVQGEVRVIFNDEIYKYPSNFPQELENLISNDRNWESNDKVVVGERNWSEIFYKIKDEKEQESFVIDIEGKSSKEIQRLMLEYLKWYEDQ